MRGSRDRDSRSQKEVYKEREMDDEEKERKRAERKAREKEEGYQVIILCLSLVPCSSPVFVLICFYMVSSKGQGSDYFDNLYLPDSGVRSKKPGFSCMLLATIIHHCINVN